VCLGAKKFKDGTFGPRFSGNAQKFPVPATFIRNVRFRRKTWRKGSNTVACCAKLSLIQIPLKNLPSNQPTRTWSPQPPRRSTTPNFEIKPGVVSRVLTTSGELTEYSPDVVSGRISRILTSIRVYPSAEHLYHAVPITLLFCRSPLAPPCWPKNALYVGSRVNHNPYRPPAMRILILVSASGMEPLPRTCRQMPG
jgi:hypothetical protein